MKANKRIAWVDSAKAILIYLMVICHCGAPEYQQTLIYSFHMPAFFIISGYLYRPHKWYQSIKSFIIPLFFYSCINFIIYLIPKLIKGTFDSQFLFRRTVFPFFITNYEGYDYIALFVGSWFIIVLLMSRLIVGDISHLSFIRKYPILLIGFCIIILLFDNYYHPTSNLKDSTFYRMLPSLPFFLTGIILKDKLNLNKINNITLFLLLILFICISYSQGRCDIFFLKFGLGYPLFFANAILGSIVFFKLLSYLPPVQIFRITSIGTLLILGCHIFLRNWIVAFISLIGININHNIHAAIVGIIILIMCYHPIRLINQYKPILLGKS